MAISSQRLTIYLYSAHRAIIFAIAQLSCSMIHQCDRQTDRQTDGRYHIRAIAYMLSRVKKHRFCLSLDRALSNFVRRCKIREY